MARILIAERDEGIATLLRTAVCRALECEVTLAHDAESATGLLRSRTFDLALLDISMKSDGLETLAHVRDRNERCEVIVLTTGVIQAPLVRTLSDADVFAVVTKPFDLQQLAQLVVECLRHDRVADPNQPLVYRMAGDEPTLK